MGFSSYNREAFLASGGMEPAPHFERHPHYSQAEIDLVGDVLRSGKVNYWTGSEGQLFEAEFAKAMDCLYASTCSNGTTALDLALLAGDIGEGDEVILPSRTFLATASSVVLAGATPVFADVQLQTGNIDPESILSAITAKTKAIICVHLAGRPCDMGRIMQIADEYGLFVIEDCAQAHGAKYNGRSVGSIGHVGTWSFCQDKIITTGGEGGMVTTNSEKLWHKMWAYKDHGKDYAAVMAPNPENKYKWVHHTFGTNWRMTELQSALGRYQLANLPAIQADRISNAYHIMNACKPWSGEDSYLYLPDLELEEAEVHAFYKLYIHVRPENLPAGWSRDEIMETLTEMGVPCYMGICSEVYREKAFEGREFEVKERLPNAKQLGETGLMFYVHPALSEEAIEYTCSSLVSVLKAIDKYA